MRSHSESRPFATFRHQRRPIHSEARISPSSRRSPVQPAPRVTPQALLRTLSITRLRAEPTSAV
jgi:hypothetical protein